MKESKHPQAKGYDDAEIVALIKESPLLIQQYIKSLKKCLDISHGLTSDAVAKLRLKPPSSGGKRSE